MTINQLQSLSESELDMLLYIVNHLYPIKAPNIQFEPTNLTWIRHDMLVKKIMDAFPQVTPDSYPIYSSLLLKLGVRHEIKHEVKPPVSAQSGSVSVEPPISSSVESK